MLLGRLHNVSYVRGEITVLENVQADLPKGACIAVVGANGAGKSTFLTLLAGENKPTSGEINWHGQKPAITFLKQTETGEVHDDWNDAAIRAYQQTWKLAEPIASITSASGGERMKLRLASAFAENSDLLLLDEPTNHLDQDSLKTLAQLIQHQDRTIIMVSHDRYFIDQTADYIFEIAYGKLTVYQGNYSAYRERKQAEREIQRKHYEQQQRKIAQVAAQMKELEGWSAKAHATSTKKEGVKEYYRVKAKKRDKQIKSKQKRLEAELAKEKVEKPAKETEISLEIQGQRKKGKRVLALKDVGKSFGAKSLLQDVTFTIQAGERVALIGANGAGKSTLLKMILGETAYQGEIWKTNAMKIGYLSQTMDDLPNDMTISAYFDTETFKEQGQIRIQLANLGFSEAHWDLPLGNLSEGEKLKIKLMQFIMAGTDVLLLDEPTNHLDLPSREELERTLAAFPGTLLFASHDRYFTEKLSEALLVFESGTVRKVSLGLKAWEENKKKPQQIESVAEERLRLETELQAVLGELSLLQQSDAKYADLDRAFLQISKQLRVLNEKKS